MLFDSFYSFWDRILITQDFRHESLSLITNFVIKFLEMIYCHKIQNYIILNLNMNL